MFEFRILFDDMWANCRFADLNGVLFFQIRLRVRGGKWQPYVPTWLRLSVRDNNQTYDHVAARSVTEGVQMVVSQLTSGMLTDELYWCDHYRANSRQLWSEEIAPGEEN